MNLVGQLFGGLAVVLGFVTYQVKSAKNIIWVQMATALVFCIHYVLIGAISACALNAVVVVRNLVYANRDKKIFSGKAVPVIFALIMAIIGFISWQNTYSLFVIAGQVINTIALSFKNPQNIRKSILISSPLVLIYDVFMCSTGGIIYESIVIISSVIGIIRYRRVD